MRGFSLLEALFALGLISFMLLGLTRYQVLSMQYMKAAFLQSMAINQLQEAAWCITHHLKLRKNSLLPAMAYQLQEDDLEIRWQSALPIWQCSQPPRLDWSCLTVKIKK